MSRRSVNRWVATSTCRFQLMTRAIGDGPSTRVAPVAVVSGATRSTLWSSHACVIGTAAMVVTKTAARVSATGRETSV